MSRLYEYHGSVEVSAESGAEAIAKAEDIINDTALTMGNSVDGKDTYSVIEEVQCGK